MNFDTNILNIICEHIDDPKTFFNFALVCRKTRYVSKLRKNNKMDEFAIKYVKTIDNEYVVERRLPNGKLHGEYQRHWVNGSRDFCMYYNGICLADCFIRGLRKRINITHYKCDCTKDFENSYTNDKIGLDGVRYKLLETNTRTYNCDICGEHKTEEEFWWNYDLDMK